MTRPAHACALQRAPRKTCRSPINFGRFIRTSSPRGNAFYMYIALRGWREPQQVRRIPLLDVPNYTTFDIGFHLNKEIKYSNIRPEPS